jgi:kynureninase
MHAVSKVNQAIVDWSTHAVTAWNSSEWIDLPSRIGSKIAPLIGASPEEVIVSDSTSVNLFKVLYSAYHLNAGRNNILTDSENFPADHYIAQGIANIDEKLSIQYVTTDEIDQAMNESVAVLLLTHVNYRSGQIYDMQAITKKAHSLGIIVVWDLSHSIGAMPLDLQACDVDFAVGCTYKYLSGGPGSPSFIYINSKHHATTRSPITGWMGHQDPFGFRSIFAPVSSAAKYLVGTPYILSLKALEGALEIFADVDLLLVRERSLIYSEYLMQILAIDVPELHCVSPKDPSTRGGHIAFTHENAFAISRALIEQGVICDFRAPNLLRLCVNPLYLTHENIKTCIEHIKEILHNQHYLESKYQYKLKVT